MLPTLKKSRDFRTIQRFGSCVRGPLFVLYSRKSAPCRGQIGFTVAKFVGPACSRNLIRRRLKHLAFENAQIMANHNWVIVARPPANDATFCELRQVFEQALSRSLRSSK